MQPLWKIGTRVQATRILVESRERTMSLIAELNDKQMKLPTRLGGGLWSVRDLLGHLAGYEEQAAALIMGGEPGLPYANFPSVDERNAADIERKRTWSVKRVMHDLETRRGDLLGAIEATDDEAWLAKVQTRTGRSALALVVGRLLAGGRYGLFAHDLAHIQDLKRSIKELEGARDIE